MLILNLLQMQDTWIILDGNELLLIHLLHSYFNLLLFCTYCTTIQLIIIIQSRRLTLIAF